MSGNGFCLWVSCFCGCIMWCGLGRTGGSMLRNGLSCGGNIFVGVYNRTSSLLALKPDKDLPRQAAAANV